MARVAVVVIASLLLIIGISSGPAQSWGGYSCPPPSCQPPPCPQRTLVTRMVPCMKTEMVAEVLPCTRTVPVQMVGYKSQKVMLRGFPTGQPCGLDPCTKCCPQPFCEVVDQKVPYIYYEYKTVPDYRVVYKPVCRPVMLPQTYMVEATPLCR
jgi:hypothetical protein